MKGWKVLTMDRESCRCEIWSIKYLKNIEVFPILEGSKLFFFKNFEDAEKFTRDCEIIVPCIAKGVTKVKWVGAKIHTIQDFWEKRSKTKNRSKKKAPEGTYLAESITCLE